MKGGEAESSDDDDSDEEEEEDVKTEEIKTEKAVKKVEEEDEASRFANELDVNQEEEVLDGEWEGNDVSEAD